MIHIQVSDMNIRERLTMSRPSPHQRRSLKETYTNSLKNFFNPANRGETTREVFIA